MCWGWVQLGDSAPASTQPNERGTGANLPQVTWEGWWQWDRRVPTWCDLLGSLLVPHKLPASLSLCTGAGTIRAHQLDLLLG